jgi:hypothetical protein
VTFNFINVTWVFFRAESMDDALKVLKGMVGGGKIQETFSAGFGSESSVALVGYAFWLIATAVLLFLGDRRILLSNLQHLSARKAVAGGVLFAMSMLMSNSQKVSEFLYFEF